MAEIKEIDPSWGIEKDCVQGLPHITSMLSWPITYYQKRIQKLGFVGKKTRLLDAACGCAVWAVAGAGLNKEICGIDSTKEYLAVGESIKVKLKIENLKLKLGKLESLPYPDKYFDYIVCYNAWMYTNREKSLKEMDRVLKPGGMIYLASIAGLGYYWLLSWQAIKAGDRGLLLTALKAIKDKVYMTEKQSIKLLEKQGFKVFSLGGDAEIGKEKIKVKPIFPIKKMGFWVIYEILAEKNKSKIKHQKSK